MNPSHLVPTLTPGVCASRFPSERSVLWTLLYTGNAPYYGKVLKVPHRAGASYRDERNGLDLAPEITADGDAVISLSMAPGAAGCVVQTW